jgi:chromosome partitioning protein
MRVWAIVNQKGGSGKSTLATQLAVHADEKGEMCCLIDLDPQASAAQWLVKRGTKQPLVLAAVPEKVAEIVGAAKTMGVSLVLIDTASKIDASALAAIRVADLVLCPTLASLFDLAALADTVRLLDLAEKKAAAVVVVNRVSPNKAATTLQHAAAAVAGTGIDVSSVYVCDRPQFVAAIDRGKSVTETNPKTPAADEIRRLFADLDRRSPSPAKRGAAR